MDVELLAVPTAWLDGFDADRWDRQGMCPQAHGVALQANLNQMFVACASQVGHPGGHEFLGSSVVADPFGAIALGPLSASEGEVAMVTVDLASVGDAQQRSTLISPRDDRRTDVYGVMVEGMIL
jgi:predicted amidohydrolase